MSTQLVVPLNDRFGDSVHYYNNDSLSSYFGKLVMKSIEISSQASLEIGKGIKRPIGFFDLDFILWQKI